MACALYLPIELLGYNPSRYALQALLGLVLFEKVWNLSENIESITNWFDRRGMKNQLRLIMLFMLVLGICHIFVNCMLIVGTNSIFSHISLPL